MTMRMSTGLTNFLANGGSLAEALTGGHIKIFTSVQPASADAAEQGATLCDITDNSQARTAEVLSTGTLTLTGGGAGSVDTVTVNAIDVLGGAVAFNGTLNQTAADVAAKINANMSAPNYVASALGAVVTIKAMPGTGASPNTFAVAATTTTITTSNAAFAGGVTAVNGLKFDAPAAGILAKRTGQTWSGVNAAGGVAGWFRFYGSVADAGAIDATGTAIRMDGAISTAGAEMNLTNTTFAAAVPTVIASGTATVPAQ